MDCGILTEQTLFNHRLTIEDEKDFWDGTMVAKIAIQVLTMENQACLSHTDVTDDHSSWIVLQMSDTPDQYRVAGVVIDYSGLRRVNILICDHHRQK